MSRLQHISRRALPGLPTRPALAPAMIFCSLAEAAPAAEPAAGPSKTGLRLLLAGSLIQNVNRADVMVAFKLGVEIIGRDRGFMIEAGPGSSDRLEEVDKRLREKALDMVISTSPDNARDLKARPESKTAGTAAGGGPKS